MLAALTESVRLWVQEHVLAFYAQGQRDAAGGLIEMGLDETPTPLDVTEGAHRASVENLANNLYADLVQANQEVGRRVRDAFREAGLEATTTGRAQGETISEIKKRLAQTVAEKGLPAFVDKNGREWRPDAYAGMAARTTLAEAQNLGQLNQLEEFGENLVQITEHRSSCPICSRYEGRVYSVAGEDDRYPSLRATAFGSDFHTVHPNCRHRIRPYVEDLADDPRGDRVRSNEPFADDRTEAQKKAYAEQQAKKRRAREKRLKREEAHLEEVR